MTFKVSQGQVFAWRMGRQLLEPVGSLDTTEVARRLCGVQAQVASTAELAIRVRRRSSRAGDVSRALADGGLIRTWAMRGTLHLLDPATGGAFLSLIASGRSWERKSWQRYFGVSTAQIDQLCDVVAEALDGRVLTRAELIEAVVQTPGLEHLDEQLRSGWSTLLKPLAWRGVLCQGPGQGNRVTFTSPAAASDRWAGLPEPEAAAPLAIEAYLGAHGPSTGEAFGNWLSGGFFGTRKLRTWFDELGDRLTTVEVDGQPAQVPASLADELADARPTDVVRLLPGFDQYVLGPGTADSRVVPAKRRTAVSKQSGWIAPVVLAGGQVSGTWELDDETIRVAWFREAGRMPRHALGAEVERLGVILDRSLRLAVSRV